MPSAPLPSSSIDVQQAPISVVVSTYNRAALCRRLVESLCLQDVGSTRFQIVVVDNGSNDDTWETLEGLSRELPISMLTKRIEVNRGPAAARNLGWRCTSTPYVAFIDDDCVPSSGWLSAGLRGLQASEVGVVQGRTTQPPDFIDEGLPRWQHRQNVLVPSPWFESCNIFYRREALEQAGGFDERVGWWGEDTALGWSVLEAGWQRSFAAEAHVIHDVQLRGWRWHVRAGLLERRTVAVASQHGGLRQSAFWRPWAFRQRDACFALAVVGAVGAVRWRPALIGVMPYLAVCRPHPSHGVRALQYWLEEVGLDAARSAGHLAGSLRSRTVVL